MRFLLALSLVAALLFPAKGYPYIWEAEEENDNMNEVIQENEDNSGSGNQDEDEDNQASGEERKRSIEDEKEHESSHQNDAYEHQPEINGPITVTPFKAKTKFPEDFPQYVHTGAHPFNAPIIPLPVGKGIRKGSKGSFFFSSPYGSLKITPFKVTKNKNVKKRCVCAFAGGCPGEFEISGFPCGCGMGSYGMGGCGGPGCMCGMGGGCNGWGGCGGGFNGGCGFGGGCQGGCCGGFRPVPMPMVMSSSKSDEKEQKDEPSSSANEGQKVDTSSDSSKSKQADSTEGDTTLSQPGKPDQKTPAQPQNTAADQQLQGGKPKASPPDDKNNDAPTADSPNNGELKPVMVKLPDAEDLPGEAQKNPSQKP